MSNRLDQLSVGELVVSTFVQLPANSLRASNIPVAAGIETSKTIHRHLESHSQSGTVAAATQYVHICRAAGTVIDIEVAINTPPSGDYTISIDLKKSTAAGAFASILSATIDLDSSTVARTAEAGSISADDLVDGDILSIVVTVAGSSGTQGSGLVVALTIDEAP